MFLKYNLYGVLWMGLMFLLNFYRQQSLPQVQVFYFIYVDKVAHFLQFLILTFLLLVGCAKQDRFYYLRINAVRIVILFSLGYMIVLQGIHFFIAPVYFQWGDVLANAAGIFLGFSFFYFIYKF